MERGLCHALHDIVHGKYYSERIVNEALIYADTAEVTTCLNELSSGYQNENTRMVIEDFIVRLNQNNQVLYAEKCQ